MEVAKRAFPHDARHVEGMETSAEEPVDASSLACKVVQDHGPHWLLTMDAGGAVISALVTGETVDWGCCGLVAGTPNRHVDSVSVADIDRDGTDEIFSVETREGHEGYSAATLGIREPTDASDRRGEVEIARSSRFDGWACRSTWRLVPGPKRAQRLEVIGACTGAAPDGYPTGRHRYEWGDGGLTATAGRGRGR